MAQTGLEGTERNNLVGVNKVSLDYVSMDLLGLLNVGVVLKGGTKTGVRLVFMCV